MTFNVKMRYLANYDIKLNKNLYYLSFNLKGFYKENIDFVEKNNFFLVKIIHLFLYVRYVFGIKCVNNNVNKLKKIICSKIEDKFEYEVSKFATLNRIFYTKEALMEYYGLGLHIYRFEEII